MFTCGCEIRWLQLWQQRGEAGLGSQQLYCSSDVRNVPLQNMNISNCGKMKESVFGLNIHTYFTTE